MRDYDYIVLVNENGVPYLAHHGIKGQKWGVRRFQNPDMTWTEAGKERYGTSSGEHKSKDKKSGMSDETKKKLKTAAIVGGSLLAAGAAAYGAYKLNDVAVTSLRYEDMKKGLEYIKKRDDWSTMAAKNMSMFKESDSRGEYSRAADYLKIARDAEGFRDSYERDAHRRIERAALDAYSAKDRIKELRRLASRK